MPGLGMLFRFIKKCWAKLLQIKAGPTHTMEKSLTRYISNGGLIPRTVFDVGAAYGTHDLYRAFPNSMLVIIEPLEEFYEQLNKVQQGMKETILVPAAAGSQKANVDFYVHKDLVGSSIHNESEELVSSEAVTRRISVTTLNYLVELHSLKGPFFIKVDTQGHEWPVIQGSSAILDQTAGIILELSLFEFFEESLLAGPIISKMNEIGFVLYDIFDHKHRILDGALGQFDALFVPYDSILRSEKHYATPEQRKKQDSEILKYIRKITT